MRRTVARPNSAADGSTQISPKGPHPIIPGPPPLARKLGLVTEMRPSCSTVERGIQCPGLSMPIAEPRTEIINMTSFNAERVARRHSCRLATAVGSLRLRPSSEQLDTARES